MTWQIITADVLEGLASLPDESVQTVITSPPYWGLRDYGTADWEGGDAACDHETAKRKGRVDYGFGEASQVQTSNVSAGFTSYAATCPTCGAVRVDKQLGLEPTPEDYVARIVEVFREVKRVLRRDGTAWVNLGDSYANSGVADSSKVGGFTGDRIRRGAKGIMDSRPREIPRGLKPKDLVGIPWRVAFALQADGWYLRSDVIWSKPNPMPESVTDRPTKAHEYVFLLTRSARYFYDADAVREPDVTRPQRWLSVSERVVPGQTPQPPGIQQRAQELLGQGRNLRSVWSIPTEPFPQAHFATFPKALVVPCIKAGTSEKGCCPECGAAAVRQVDAESSWAARREAGATRGNLAAEGLVGAGTQRGVHGAGVSHDLDGSRTTTGWLVLHDAGCSAPTSDPVPCTVLDPFAGSGTVGVVALRHGRSFVGIELNEDYAEMARRRISDDAPLFNVPAEVR